MPRVVFIGESDKTVELEAKTGQTLLDLAPLQQQPVDIARAAT